MMKGFLNVRMLLYQNEIRQARKKLDEQYYSKNKCPYCSAPYDYDVDEDPTPHTPP